MRLLMVLHPTFRRMQTACNPTLIYRLEAGFMPAFLSVLVQSVSPGYFQGRSAQVDCRRGGYSNWFSLCSTSGSRSLPKYMSSPLMNRVGEP